MYPQLLKTNPPWICKCTKMHNIHVFVTPIKLYYFVNDIFSVTFYSSYVLNVVFNTWCIPSAALLDETQWKSKFNDLLSTNHNYLNLFSTVVNEVPSHSNGCDMSFIKNAVLTLRDHRTDEMTYLMTCQPGTTSITRIITCRKNSTVSWRWDVENVPLCTRKLTCAVAGKKFFGWCPDRMESRTLSWRRFHSGSKTLASLKAKTLLWRMSWMYDVFHNGVVHAKL